LRILEFFNSPPYRNWDDDGANAQKNVQCDFIGCFPKIAAHFEIEGNAEDRPDSFKA
jgi:hypothetical protein